MGRLKVGVIGAGCMGKNHIRVYKELTNQCELVGFYDINKDAAPKIMQQYSVNYFDDVFKLLEAVEAVSIATPTSTHKFYGTLCAECKKNILLEKPIANSTNDAMELVKTCEENGVLLQIGHIERFNPAVMELLNILKSQDIISLDFQRLSPYDGRINDTDVVKDLMIHDIDIMNLIVNSDITTLYAHGKHIFSENSIDYAQALITFNNNIMASLTSSRVTEDKIRSICINTKNARIYVDLICKSIKISRKSNFKLDTGSTVFYKHEKIEENVFVQQHEPLKAQLQSFLECINQKKNPIVDGYEGLKALSIADRICTQV